MQYLLRESRYKSKQHKKKQSVAHIWNGVDTLCRMFSTGGFDKSQYVVCDNTQDRGVCQMCGSISLTEDKRAAEQSAWRERMARDADFEAATDIRQWTDGPNPAPWRVRQLSEALKNG